MERGLVGGEGRLYRYVERVYRFDDYGGFGGDFDE
jgi:hypothetical protein